MKSTLVKLFSRPTSAFGATVTLMFVLLALAGSWITPYGPTERNAQDACRGFPPECHGPSASHWLGADHLGRDVFSRIVSGAQSILTLAGLGTVMAVLLGTLFGLFSGFRGGWFDELLMRGFDSVLAMPALLLALLLLGTVGPSRDSVLWVIVIVYTPIVARVVRSEVLHIKVKGFIEAARLRGERLDYILFREILPSVLPALSVEASLRFSYAIFLVASLGFLGVGVQPPTPDWGLMVNEARNTVSITPWALGFPALAIALLVVSVNLMSDGLKTALQTSSATVQRLPKFQREVSEESQAHNPNALISFENTTVSYWQGKRRLDAVREVALAVERGQSYGLVGESGSGKSTLAMALMRYLPGNGAVTQGRVRFRSEDVVELDDEAMRAHWQRSLKLVPQNPLTSLNPSMTIGEQMLEALGDTDGADPKAAMRTWLEKVRLADPERVIASYPHQLSGGMQQRVMIAMALCTAPDVLVLDEPTTGLDVTTEAVILDLVRDLVREGDTASLYISHDLGVVANLADRVAVLYAGELVEEAATDDLYNKPLHPYTQGLLASVPRLERHKTQGVLPSMPGVIPSLTEIPGGCVFADRCPLAVDRCFAERPASEVVTRNGSIRRVRCHRWEEVWEGLSGFEVSPATEKRSAAETTDETTLSIDDLKTHFPVRRSLSEIFKRRPVQQVKAVDGVSVNLIHAQTLGLVGESGSGKTTLARSLFGLTPPTEGEVSLDAQPLPARLRKRKLDILRRLQAVDQNPEDALNPYLTVTESVHRPLLRLRKLSRAEANATVEKLLKQVGLDEAYTTRLPHQLSGGEKQRVAIARALAAEPSVIVCDEPTSALDVSVQARILNLLTRLQRNEGQTYLFISHDLATVSYLADHIAVMYLGRLMEVGKRASVLRPPYHPYTEALLSAVPRPDPHAESDTIRLEGSVPSPIDAPTGCPFHTRCPRFLGDVCVRQTPPWQQDDHGHAIFCHIPLEDLKRDQTAMVHIDNKEPG